MTRVVGFTGTRRGLTVGQRITLRHMLSEIERTYLGACLFVHGGCVGADEEAHALALYDAHFDGVEVHPCDIPSMRAASCGASECVYVWPPLPPLERNHRIVDRSDFLIACPDEPDEQLRSGTWATVRYARRAGKRVWLVLPDGSVRGP